jgi:hypothetical protein
MLLPVLPAAVKPLPSLALADVVELAPVGVEKLLAADEALAPEPAEMAILPALVTVPILLSPLVILKPSTIATPGMAGTVTPGKGWAVPEDALNKVAVATIVLAKPIEKNLVVIELIFISLVIWIMHSRIIRHPIGIIEVPSMAISIKYENPRIRQNSYAHIFLHQ